MRDDRLGEIELLASQTGATLCSKVEEFADIESFRARLSELQALQSANYQYRLPIIEVSFQDKTAVFGKTFSIKTTYHYPESDLELQIQAHKKKDTHFDHNELLLMAYQILHGLTEYHSNLETFDDLRPMHIEWQAGTFHCICRLIDRLPPFDNVLQSQSLRIQKKEALYCSPLIFNNTMKRQLGIGDLRKNDLWALGMCLLEAGTLNNLQDCYDFASHSIDSAKLKHHVLLFRRRYEERCPLLCQILGECLITEENKRPTPMQLLGALKPLDQLSAAIIDQQLSAKKQEYLEHLRSIYGHYEQPRMKNTRLVEHYSINQMLHLPSPKPTEYFNKEIKDSEFSYLNVQAPKTGSLSNPQQPSKHLLLPPGFVDPQSQSSVNHRSSHHQGFK